MADQQQEPVNVEMALEALEILSERTTSIIVAFVSNNQLHASDLPTLITLTHRAVVDAMMMLPGDGAPPSNVDLPTKKQIDASVGQDGIVSFIDGKSYKTLKRHLTAHGLTPASYRERYGLPAGYPMTSASYSEARSALAKKNGLGQPGAMAREAA